jgi:hypothetical protein
VRRFAPALAALLVLAMAAPAAQATYHLNHVNEVGLSVGGAQFVETLDPGEPFPVVFAPYKLIVYTASGSEVGQQTLEATALANRSTPVLIADQATVGGQARDIALTAGPLPAEGQACFFGNGSNVHCMRWGNVSVPVSASSSDAGPAPSDGQALQRCPTGAAVAVATPKAANSCGGGTGGGGTGGGGGGTTDTTKPRATLTAAAQKLGRVISSGYRLKVRSNEQGKARAQLLRKGKVLRTSTKSLSAGVAKAFTLALPRATKLALAGARSATFTLRIRVTDAAGNVRNLTRTLTLRR